MAGVPRERLKKEGVAETSEFLEIPIPARIYRDLEGTVDLHIHGAPDDDPRLLDDVEVAAQAKAVGMRAVVLKCHVSATPDRAYIARRAVGGGIEVFGIVCLNPAVGGLNPEAVRMALRMGAKGIWMPSRWSEHNIQYVRQAGRYMGIETLGFKYPDTMKGITILTDDGHVRPEVKDILGMVAESDVMLSTGHLSLKEAKLLLWEAKEAGVERMLVHTVNYHVMGYPLEELRRMVEMGAVLEFSWSSLPNPIWEPVDPARRISLDDVCRTMRSVGAESCVLTSDAGQITSPPPIECMRLWIELLRVKGFTQRELDLMTKTNPAALLGLNH